MYSTRQWHRLQSRQQLSSTGKKYGAWSPAVVRGPCLRGQHRITELSASAPPLIFGLNLGLAPISWRPKWVSSGAALEKPLEA